MSYSWRYERTDGTVVPGPETSFADQAGAEEWFGAEWEGLAEDGVEQVVLLDDGAGGAPREVYGPMPLSP